MLACYRRDDAIEPEMYSAAVAATLTDFSRDVVDFITDPRTGIASQLKFLPSVAEVREACELEREKMWKRKHATPSSGSGACGRADDGTGAPRPL